MPRLLDACYRGAFRLAYPLAMLWWGLRGNTGITVAVWVGERVLLVRHSYKPGLRLPGGSVRSGEDHSLAAARELQEEVGLTVPLNDLHLVGPFQNTYGIDYLYEIELPFEPKLLVDRREIVSARFMPANVARERNQLLHRYLQAGRSSRRGVMAPSRCYLGAPVGRGYRLPQVLNVRQLPGFSERRPIIPLGAVYIGRRNARYGLPASQWANPFRVSQEADRASAIAAYERWLRQQPRLMAALHELQGCDLVCWCAPLSCHGDVLLRRLELSLP